MIQRDLFDDPSPAARSVRVQGMGTVASAGRAEPTVIRNDPNPPGPALLELLDVLRHPGLWNTVMEAIEQFVDLLVQLFRAVGFTTIEHPNPARLRS